MSRPENTRIASARFSIGQIVRHRLYGYRGVIFDVDASFSQEEEWYESMAKSRPPKNSPWYHVLVDGADYTTYVAEQNLGAAEEIDPIDHPLVAELFILADSGEYVSRDVFN